MSSVNTIRPGISTANLKPFFRGSEYAKQLENVTPEVTDLGNGVVVQRRDAEFKMVGDAPMSMRAKLAAYEASEMGGKVGQAMFDTYRKTHPEEFGAAAVARDKAIMSGEMPAPPPPSPSPSGNRVELQDGAAYAATDGEAVNVSGGRGENVTGSAASDFITLLHDATVYGLAGNDHISGWDRARLNGGDGDDWLSAGKDSTLVGGAGNDHLEARKHSVLDGGDGDDVLSAYDNSTLIGGAGNDRLNAHDNAVADGGEGDDLIEAYGNARITDSGGDNDISAYTGARVTAGAGNDRISAYDYSVIDAGDGSNYVVAGAISTVTSGSGDDWLRVGGGSDVTAGAGDDRVSVDGGAIIHFNRGDGHDVIDGGPEGLIRQSTDRLSSSTLAFGAGIVPGDVSIQRNGDDVLVSIGNDSVTLRNVGRHGIPTMTFADGSTLNAEQVQAMADQTAQRLRAASRVYQTQVNTTGTVI